ncbi:fibrinogen-like protein A [Mytilus trossulus]|uniref:fibrinogen-like protein A n=1 Tax=Mytilus trossulus TaxID=6551 RepID=UPI003004627E
MNGTVDFYREWKEYETGFGNLDSEFWLGNNKLNVLTSTGNYKLFIHLEDFEGNSRYAEYSKFSVGDATTNFILNIDGYSGDAGDEIGNSNDMMFSTSDRDNDRDQNLNCAKDLRGGWWYYFCLRSNLNGRYSKGNNWDQASSLLRPRDCSDLPQGSCSGVYTIYPTNKKFDVYCDMDTAGFGWTVFQNRINGEVDFYRGWNDYKIGFGNLTSEFWLGNDFINVLTSSGDYKLYIHLEDFEGDCRYAEYSEFSTGDVTTKFTLNIAGYSGDADSRQPKENMVTKRVQINIQLPPLDLD